VVLVNVRLGVLVVVGLLAGCRGFAPASAEAKSWVRPMELAESMPAEQFVVEIESAHLAGIYDALLVAEGGVVRMQLFPDVGGKVLDLTVAAAHISCELPDASYRAEPPYAAAEPHLALVFAAIFAELRSPPAARVIGERREAGRIREVQLEPALGSGTVTATLLPDGQIQCYRISLGYLEFSLSGDGSFAGPGFAGRLCP